MIVFDLRCGSGHVFEAWFGSSRDYDDQSQRGLLACPICGAAEVVKAVMAPSLPAKANRANEPSPAGVKALLGSLATAQRKALAGSEHVGTRFAAEARAIHLGDAEARSIHGQATASDARALADEGVRVAPLPLPFVPPELEN